MLVSDIELAGDEKNIRGQKDTISGRGLRRAGEGRHRGLPLRQNGTISGRGLRPLQDSFPDLKVGGRKRAS